MKKRPLGVTFLAVLAGALAVLSGIHALQALGIFPFLIGPFSIHAFSLWSFLMWAIMVWIYVWLVQMLWNMEKSGCSIARRMAASTSSATAETPMPVANAWPGKNRSSSRAAATASTSTPPAPSDKRNASGRRPRPVIADRARCD